MSPRAAWRLEQIGVEAYDYAGGKMDWLSFGFPYEGEARLVTRQLQPVPSVRFDTSIAEARQRSTNGVGGVLVVTNEHSVVLGLLQAADLGEDDAVLVSDVMQEGPATVRPSEEAAPLAHRMQHADLESVLVTRSDGTLLGHFSG